MKYIKSKILLTILPILLLICGPLVSQNIGNRWSKTYTIADQRYFININEQSKESKIFEGKLKPSIGLGFERNLREKNYKNRWYQGFELQAFNYKYVDFGGSLITNLGYERMFFNKLLIGTSLGVGGQLAWKNEKYQTYNGNEWESHNDLGKPIRRTLLQLKANLGWKVSPLMDAFVVYRYQITTPFYKPADIPVMLSKGIELGVRFRL
jgi:hypothetical protein